MNLVVRWLLVAAVLLCACVSSAAIARRYSPLRAGMAPNLAAMPNSEIAVAFSGGPSAIFTIDRNGKVLAARSVTAQLLPRFVVANEASEIFLGLAPALNMVRSAVVTKLRANLSVTWSRLLANEEGGEVRVERGAASRDGGVLLAGSDRQAAIVVKLDGKGNVQWSTRIDVSGEGELFDAIRELPGGGVIAAGRHPGGAWLVRLAPDGRLLWQHSYPMHYFEALAVARDGGFVCVGGAAIVRLDGDGKPVWKKVFAKAFAHAVVETANGFAVALSHSETPGLTVVMLKADGALLWKRSLTGPHEIMKGWYRAEAAMLVAAPSGVALAVALSTGFMPLFPLDGKTGQSDCGWFQESPLQADEKPIRTEDVAVEVSRPLIAASPVQQTLTPLALQMEAETCPAGKPPASSASSRIPPSRTADFQVSDPAEASYGKLLLTRKFGELDAIAATLRHHPQPSDPLQPQRALGRFYDAFTSLHTGGEEERLSALREWVETRPESFTARIALSGALGEAAWSKRGYGYMSAVTATGVAGYQRLMEEAVAILRSVGKEAETDTEYWVVRASLAGQLGHEDVREVGRRGLALHPDSRIAGMTANFLHPDWGGSTEEILTFADEAARLTYETLGDALYAHLAARFENTQEVRDLKERGFDWVRVRKGFEDAFQRNPGWLPSYHRFAWLARQRDDQVVAYALFQRPQLEWYEGATDIWLSRESYEYAREWALQSKGRPTPVTSTGSPVTGPASPAAQAIPERAQLAPPRDSYTRLNPTKWPRFVIERSSIAKDGGEADELAFLVDHAGAVVVVGVGVEPTFPGNEDSLRARALVPRGKATTKALQAFPPGDIPPFNRPVDVIACKQAGRHCVQTVLRGRVITVYGGKDSRRHKFEIGLDEVPEATITLRGAAVVDERGYVFAVVTKPSSTWVKDVKFVLTAEDVVEALDP